jgi:uncharacterized cupin superfamily protein
MPLAHWDDVTPETEGIHPMLGRWYDLGGAAGSRAVGLVREQIDAGCQPSPAHRHGAEEEIFFVLGGDGLSWHDGATHAVRAGDVVVHRAAEHVHTFVAGDGGIDLLAFGPRILVEATHLPRAGVVRIQETWVEAPGGDHPWEREAAAGRVELPAEPSPRPPEIVALADVPAERIRRARTDIVRRDLGRAAGSVSTGMRHIAVQAGAESYPPHAHSAEEELFVVLGGSGTAHLGDEGHPLRRGSVVSRPAGTGVAHAFSAGDEGLELLAYGQRDLRDLCWYPRSRKVSVRGLGVMFRVEEPLDYWDGEE